MRLLVEDQLPLLVVARKCGVHRSTVWRWKRKWDVLNQHVQLTNDNRPNRAQAGPSSSFRLAAITWRIPTDSARPHASPTSVSAELVQLVLAVRAQLKRCAEVVWHHLVTKLDVSVSLSSVRRILWRAGVARGRKPRVKRDNPKRPLPVRPGELVQTDTIHHVDPYSGKKLYYYTVIDLFTRMAYVTLSPRLGAGLVARAVLNLTVVRQVDELSARRGTHAAEKFQFAVEIIHTTRPTAISGTVVMNGLDREGRIDATGDSDNEEQNHLTLTVAD